MSKHRRARKRRRRRQQYPSETIFLRGFLFPTTTRNNKEGDDNQAQRSARASAVARLRIRAKTAALPNLRAATTREEHQTTTRSKDSSHVELPNKSLARVSVVSGANLRSCSLGLCRLSRQSGGWRCSINTRVSLLTFPLWRAWGEEKDCQGHRCSFF